MDEKKEARMPEKDVVAFEYEGAEYEADAAALRDYAVIKAVTRVDSDPAGFFGAMERVFMGRDEEYAAQAGGVGGIAELFSAAAEAANAKN